MANHPNFIHSAIVPETTNLKAGNVGELKNTRNVFSETKSKLCTTDLTKLTEEVLPVNKSLIRNQ